jgi:hypothetical protein
VFRYSHQSKDHLHDTLKKLDRHFNWVCWSNKKLNKLQ